MAGGSRNEVSSMVPLEAQVLPILSIVTSEGKCVYVFRWLFNQVRQ